MKRLAWISLARLVAHGALLVVAARWSFAAALLSPGAHSQLLALAFGLAFIGLRLLVVVGLPVCWAFCLVFRLSAWLGRRPASPTRGPGPMLSAPGMGSEVPDGESR